LGGDGIRQVDTFGCEMMKEEVRRNLPKAKLPGCYNPLIEFISWFDDPVGSTHADWEEARANHDRI
jgi:hypothetical protein